MAVNTAFARRKQLAANLAKNLDDVIASDPAILAGVIGANQTPPQQLVPQLTFQPEHPVTALVPSLPLTQQQQPAPAPTPTQELSSLLSNVIGSPYILSRPSIPPSPLPSSPHTQQLLPSPQTPINGNNYPEYKKPEGELSLENNYIAVDVALYDQMNILHFILKQFYNTIKT